jgi:hypothetical protein
VPDGTSGHTREAIGLYFCERVVSFFGPIIFPASSIGCGSQYVLDEYLPIE